MSAPVYQWQPTTLEIAARAGIDPSEVIRFDHNTSPLTPDWAPSVAAEVAGGLNEYPGADYRPLREAIAAYTGTDPEQVVPGAGADELILLTAGAFLPVGGVAVNAPPTYTLYAVAAGQRTARLIEVPRQRRGFTLDMESMIPAAAEADLVWLCVPNNPTGHRDPDANLRAIIEATPGVVVLDAAYAEFSADRWAPWLEEYPNLIVLGTMSKAFALAGARVGYSLSSPELAAQLHRRRPPGSISSLSAALAQRALGEPAWAAANVARVVAERQKLADRLGDLGFEMSPTITNFVLAGVGNDARSLAETLMWEDGIVVRAFPVGSTLEFYLRFTVRSPGENDRLISTLDRRLS
jgi:histidinol-phosphate aminotransferase